MKNATGHSCTFRTSIEQSKIGKTVARVISAMVHDETFSTAIQTKIDKAINTEELEQELKTLEASLRRVESAKLRLESQMDLLDIEDPHYDRKMTDLQRRYDEKYDTIANLEDDITVVRNKIQNIRREVVTADNIYRILLAFDDLYSCMEKKELMQALIEKVEIYPEKRKNGCWIRNITFKFPTPTRDGEIKEFPLESLTTIESIVTLIRAENHM